MGVEHEKAFEEEICEVLQVGGWHYTTEAERAGYDRERALFVPDVIAWLEETQPAAWAKVVKPAMTDVEKRAAVNSVLDRLVKVLDAPIDAGGGTLNVLRKGFDKTPAKFSMCEFKPATTLNATALEKYKAVRVRVMRQVYYSGRNTNSIDLVCFINGIPVATLELKTDNTQSIEDAKQQYRDNRLPWGEPLLGFANRCLVHFAVSTDEVAMTTRLAGKDTYFLPFNMGNDGAAGNPPNSLGAASSYLWERVLRRDSWLHVIGRLLHIETKADVDPITGEVSKKTTLLFPRFHQWELVTNLMAAVKGEGPGHNYLAMHSAGSGKTNSISWTAHGLSTLHNDADKKVFDTVIVVTDRTVLDDQLQKAIKQIEGVDGTVVQINDDEVRNAGTGSKSGLLAKALLDGAHIVIVTMQTFPFALDAIRDNKGLSDKKFAIIADEAHSSQTGRTSQKLRKVLTEAELKDAEDGADIDIEAVLAAEMEGRAESPNLSFFAFTATPKDKTMRLFGRKGADGKPHAFHTYTMQQAIEEGYILDVLRNYTTYDTAFQVAEKAKKSIKTVKLVDESEATKGLMRWVSLHPTNISQKVQIIVEHYRANVRHLLDGHAKAMVVTSSREHALRYKDAIDSYIKKKGYYDIATLVAFSGSLTSDQMGGFTVPGVTPPYSESNLNKGLRGRSLPAAFASDDFQILLVANKYQTGFDQPLLCAMYVDKRLEGVTAVQTLSRLNRTYPAMGKDTTYILDFVNDPHDILESFLPYYRDAQVEGDVDPDLIHDIRMKLDAAGIYTDAEVDAFTTAYLSGRHGQMTAPLKAAADRYRTAYVEAMEGGDKGEVDRLEVFRKDVGSYLRLYDFLSQIVNYADTGLEKRSLFLRLLRKRLHKPDTTEFIDLSQVELAAIKHKRASEQVLDLRSGDTVALKPVTATGSGAARDPRMVRLEEVLGKINDLFEGEDFTPGQPQSWVESLLTVLREDEVMKEQAGANSATQFTESPDLESAVTDAVLGSRTFDELGTDKYFSDEQFKSKLVKLLGRLLYEDLSGEAV